MWKILGVEIKIVSGFRTGEQVLGGQKTGPFSLDKKRQKE
jgi:hypothetical protein